MKVSILLFLPTIASGFSIFGEPMAIRKELMQVTNSQKTIPLSIKLDVGTTDKDEARMNIVGLKLNLHSKLADDYKHPAMPGANGPHPQLSAGVRALEVVEQGGFVSLAGQQSVSMDNGCWEMVWRENAAAGSLICGFDIPEEYKRNDAVLNKGRLYMSFPVWTKVGLKEAQDAKERTLNRAKELIAEKDEELRKMEDTRNFLMKALHYRNAVAAVEQHSLQPLKSYEMVPSNDEIIVLQDDLLLTTKGLVFTKEGSFHHGLHALLGTALATSTLQETMKP